MIAKRAKERIKYKKERVILSDILPFENPIIFSNRQFYRFLIANKIVYESGEKRIKWEKTDLVLEAIVKLLFGLPGTAIANNTIKVKDLTTIPFAYKISHKEADFRALSIVHPRNQIALVEFYDRYKEMILYYCGISPFSIRKPDRVARYIYYKDRLHRESKTGLESHGIIEESGKEYENLKSFFVYRKYSNIYKFYESYSFHRCEKKYNELLKFDVTRCFDSIYTHTIVWALLNKDIVKDNNIPSSKGTFGGRFDGLMQDLNNGETNGIVIGPEFSRIFAEIILQRIDRNVIEILKKEGLFHKDHYEIFRYVDDYFVFFNETSTRDRILKEYRLQLMEYKLHVNESKIVRYAKPIITEITIAKQRIVDLLDKYLVYKIENTADDGDAKGSIHVSSNRLITKFKTIIKETEVEYKDVLNYTLAVVEQKTYRILRDYKRLNETQSESEEDLINAILEILDLSFFLYSVSPRVNITIKLCRILRRVTEFLKVRGNANVDHKHLAFKSIYDNVSFILRKNKASEPTQVETLQLLIALAEIGKEYWLDDRVLRLYFGIGQDDRGKLRVLRRLNYFSIVVLLFYMKNKTRYKELRLCLQDHILEKFLEVREDNRGKNAELVLLLFDVLACPNLPEDFKCEVLSMNGVTEKMVQRDIIGREENWFTRWTDFDFGGALDAKRSREVY
jgi:hypothetical protein